MENNFDLLRLLESYDSVILEAYKNDRKKEAREKFHMARPGEKVLIYDNNKKNAGSADEIK